MSIQERQGESDPIHYFTLFYRDSTFGYDSLDRKVIRPLNSAHDVFETAYLVLDAVNSEVDPESIVRTLLDHEKIPAKLTIYDRTSVKTPSDGVGERSIPIMNHGTVPAYDRSAINVGNEMPLSVLLGSLGATPSNDEWEFYKSGNEGSHLVNLLHHDQSPLTETLVGKRNGVILPEKIVQYSRATNLTGIYLAVGFTQDDLSKPSSIAGFPKLSYCDVLIGTEAYLASFPYKSKTS
jgi:hypothetical protein